MTFDISVIIVNYNVREFLENLLNSLLKSLKNFSYEIIVVDNASSDRSVEMLKNKFPDIILIENKVNIGFGAANNQAAKIARGKYLLLINPDALVQENTIEVMYNFMETHPDAGAAGCKVLNSDGSLQLACRRGFPGPWASFTKVVGLSSLFPKSKLFARYNLTYLDENQTYEVDAISGSFMFVRREVYEKLNGFDPDFFMYGEDLDLCYRIKKAGYKVYYVHETSIIHYKGECARRSSIDESKIFYDAMRIFVKKHLSSYWIVEIILLASIYLRAFVHFAYKKRIIIASVLLDFLFFNLSLFVASEIYFGKKWHGFPDFAIPVVFTVPATIHLFVSALIGVYKSNSLAILRSYLALFASFFVVSSTTYFFKDYAFSRAIILISYALNFFVFAFWRILFKVYFVKEKGQALSRSLRTIIIGSGEHSIELAKKLSEHHMPLRRIVGLISPGFENIGEMKGQFEVIGAYDNIKKIIKERQIDEAVFCSNEVNYSDVLKIVSDCQGENCEFKVTGSEKDFMVGKAEISSLSDLPLFSVSYNISKLENKISKYFFDKIISLFLFFLFLPYAIIQKLSGKTDSDFFRFFSQLPDVIIGKKSLVGPKNLETYNGLFLGKKGVTGLWNIEFFSNEEMSQDEELKISLYYARTQNFWLDLEIIGKTLSKIFFSK